MPKNMYDGIDPYAVSFVKQKAKELTHQPFFTPHDYPDLQQELMLAFLLAWPKFDPAKGDRRSFIKAVVNNCAHNLVIAGERQKRWMGQGLLSLSGVISEEDESLSLVDTVANEAGLWAGASLRDQELNSALHQDLDRFIATLPPDLAKLCLHLKTKTVTEISNETGISRATIRDAVKKLEKLLKKAGLKIYLS